MKSRKLSQKDYLLIQYSIFILISR